MESGSSRDTLMASFHHDHKAQAEGDPQGGEDEDRKKAIACWHARALQHESTGPAGLSRLPHRHRPVQASQVELSFVGLDGGDGADALSARIVQGLDDPPLPVEREPS